MLRVKYVLRPVQDVRSKAGGFHGTAIFDAPGRLLVAPEDIGRHNAVDKAIGHCLMHGLELSDKILVSAGRASYELIAKAVRLGILIVAGHQRGVSGGRARC